jgi:hypothetical protein
MIAILATCTVLAGLAVLYDIVRGPERPTHVPLWAVRNRSGATRTNRIRRNRVPLGLHQIDHVAATRAGGRNARRYRPGAGARVGRNERRDLAGTVAAGDQRPGRCRTAGACAWPACWDTAPQVGCAVVASASGLSRD